MGNTIDADSNPHESRDETTAEIQFNSDLRNLIAEGSEKAKQSDSGWTVQTEIDNTSVHRQQRIILTRAENRERNESAIQLVVQKGVNPNDPIEEVWFTGKTGHWGEYEKWKISYDDDESGKIAYLAREENIVNSKNEITGRKDIVYKIGKIPSELTEAINPSRNNSRKRFLQLTGAGAALLGATVAGIPVAELIGNPDKIPTLAEDVGEEMDNLFLNEVEYLAPIAIKARKPPEDPDLEMYQGYIGQGKTDEFELIQFPPDENGRSINTSPLSVAGAIPFRPDKFGLLLKNTEGETFAVDYGDGKVYKFDANQREFIPLVVQDRHYTAKPKWGGLNLGIDIKNPGSMIDFLARMQSVSAQTAHEIGFALYPVMYSDTKTPWVSPKTITEEQCATKDQIEEYLQGKMSNRDLPEYVVIGNNMEWVVDLAHLQGFSLHTFEVYAQMRELINGTSSIQIDKDGYAIITVDSGDGTDLKYKVKVEDIKMKINSLQHFKKLCLTKQIERNY